MNRTEREEIHISLGTIKNALWEISELKAAIGVNEECIIAAVNHIRDVCGLPQEREIDETDQ